MDIVNFPPLYIKKENGQVRYWEISVVPDQDNTIYVTSKYGVKDGELITSMYPVTKTVNAGKKNQLNPYQSAIKKAQKEWDDKIKEGYCETITENTMFSPMLAITYKKAKEMGHVNFDTMKFVIQRKYDGFRMITRINESDEIYNISRNLMRNYILSDEMSGELKKLFSKMPEKYRYVLFLDGELYQHGKRLEEISEIVTATKGKRDRDQMKYVIYDCFNPLEKILTYDQRYDILNKYLGPENYKTLVLADTFDVSSEKEAQDIMEDFIDEGFEGAILRNLDGIYKGSVGASSRSYDLIKLKPLDDIDCTLLDISLGPKAKSIVLHIKLPSGVKQKVNGNGSMSYRDDMLKNKLKYIGKTIKISYSTMTKEGKLRNARPTLTEGKYVFV